MLVDTGATHFYISRQFFEFFQYIFSVRYLGFVVNEKGFLIDEEKIKPIFELQTPKNVKQLQRIIGMASRYRRIIPKFSEIMEPLHILLKERVE